MTAFDAAAPVGTPALWVLGLLLGSACVLTFALTLERIARDDGTRRLVLTAAFLSLAALPGVHAFGGLWEAPLPPLQGRVSTGPVVQPATVAPAGETGIPGAEAAVDADGATGTPSPSYGRARSIPSGIFAVWLVGVVIVMAYRILGILGMLRRIRMARPAPESARARVRAAARDVGFTRPIRVLSSPHWRVPTAWSVPRPTILLPAGSGEWSESTWRSVLLHEVSHLGARDVAVRLLALAASALYWPQPLVWIAVGRLREAQERACDQAVLDAGVGPGEYAATLVALARAPGRPHAGHPGVAAISGYSVLRRRVERILQTPVRGAVARSRAPARRSAGLWLAGFTLVGGVTVPGAPAADADSPAPLGSSEAWVACSASDGDPVGAVRVEAGGVTSVRAEGGRGDRVLARTLRAGSDGRWVGQPTVCGRGPEGAVEVVIRAPDEAGDVLEVVIPRSVGLTVRTRSGSISGRALDGPLDLEAERGDISLRAVTAGGRAETGGEGAIDLTFEGVEWSGSPLELRAGAGPITLVEPEGYRAGIVSHSDDGSPTVRLPDPEDGRRIIQFPERVGKRVTVSAPEGDRPHAKPRGSRSDAARGVEASGAYGR